MLLREIVHVPPLPFEWRTNTTAEFMFDDVVFGIVLEPAQIQTPRRVLAALNISFGTVIDVKRPVSATNISRGLTGHNKPFTILSTVAAACVQHSDFLKRFSVLVLGASNSKANKRADIYWAAMKEMEPHFPEHSFHYRAKTQNGSVLLVFSNVELSEPEQTGIVNKYNLIKIQTDEQWVLSL